MGSLVEVTIASILYSIDIYELAISEGKIYYRVYSGSEGKLNSDKYMIIYFDREIMGVARHWSIIENRGGQKRPTLTDKDIVYYWRKKNDGSGEGEKVSKRIAKNVIVGKIDLTDDSKLNDLLNNNYMTLT